VLYSEHSPTATNWDAANLVVAPLSGGAPKVVVRGGYYGRYVPSGRGVPKRDEREGGHLIYLYQGTVFAVPFDLTRLETVGPAAPALEGVTAFPGEGGAKLAVSSEGTLVYVPGTAVSAARPIDWLTRDGKAALLRATNALWSNPRFSPNGQKLAIDISDGKQRDVWVYEWARDTLTQLTFDPGEDRFPVWTPDGRRLVFASDRAKAGTFNLYWANADGTGEVTRLTDSPESHSQGSSWHPSGKILAFQANRGSTRGDLMILPMEGDATRGWTPGTPTVFLSSPASETTPTFSPDGRWIAYASTEAGGAGDVYVRQFPGPGGPWRISTAGGRFPRWSATAPELLFIEGQGTIMAARYAVVGGSFRADTPRVWSPTGIQGVAPGNAGYDLHPDGKRVAAAAVADDSEGVANDKVVFFFNFGEYLKKIAPVARP
jgi:serine/threonine-protein kinase